MDRMPAGYRIEIGGAIEESARGNASIFAVFPVMVVIMLTLIMIQVQSFPKLFLVFASAPLGVIGASLALNVSAMPFGFVALLGLLALAAPWSAAAAAALATLLGLYAAAALANGLVAAPRQALGVAWATACMQLGYGLGFGRGLLDMVVLRRGPGAAMTRLTR
jgi:hypothetical protein